MGTEPCKREMPSRLERDLAEYDRIILARGRRAVQGLGAVLGKHFVFRNTDRKVLMRHIQAISCGGISGKGKCRISWICTVYMNSRTVWYCFRRRKISAVC